MTVGTSVHVLGDCVDWKIHFLHVETANKNLITVRQVSEPQERITDGIDTSGCIRDF